MICAFNRLLDVKTSSVDGDIVVSFFPNSIGMLSKGQTSVESFFRVSPGAGAVPEGHYKHYFCLSVAHFEHLEGKIKILEDLFIIDEKKKNILSPWSWSDPANYNDTNGGSPSAGQSNAGGSA